MSDNIPGKFTSGAAKAAGVLGMVNGTVACALGSVALHQGAKTQGATNFALGVVVGALGLASYNAGKFVEVSRDAKMVDNLLKQEVDIRAQREELQGVSR